ncbi:DUF3142 domain-containing protein [Pseudolysobacter antarcticus]|uniref:DUF3142 domain-containing protein n=1 Tax=Pseudolysobacter antarcticus TaxID=2511995 RepID=UPI0013EB6B6E|nr:DUF3142 domain-containing protein [Pseudolysobacter antarcticus]
MRAGVWMLACLIAGCARVIVPLEQQAYVWQRVWTPAVIDAARAAPADFSALRVLVAEMRSDGELQPINPTLTVLAQTGLPVTAVVRIDGQLAPGSSVVLLPILTALQQQFHDAGIVLRGIEIDYDCASARLPQYAVLLAELRQKLPPELRLSITALPTWLQTSELETLLASVDEVVLQVHAVQDPNRGLFSRIHAATWIAAFAARSNKPFRVALPAYGSRVDWDENGRVIAVISETSASSTGIEQRELRADPREVAVLLQALQRDPPPHLAGIVWFRLPTADDQRAWRTSTLHAVIAGQPLRADLRAQLALREAPGLYDVLLQNRGNLDADLPASVRVTASGCHADALNGYVLPDDENSPAENELHWKLQKPARLAAGQQRIIGWLRCADSLSGSVIHVEP